MWHLLSGGIIPMSTFPEVGIEILLSGFSSVRGPAVGTASPTDTIVSSFAVCCIPWVLGADLSLL